MTQIKTVNMFDRKRNTMQVMGELWELVETAMDDLEDASDKKEIYRKELTCVQDSRKRLMANLSEANELTAKAIGEKDEIKQKALAWTAMWFLGGALVGALVAVTVS